MLYTNIQADHRLGQIKYVKTGSLMIRAFCLLAILSTSVVADERPSSYIGPNSWTDDKPGIWRKQSATTLTKPFASALAAVSTKVVERPTDTLPKTIDGFHVELFASNLMAPRTIRIAPNGDTFVFETEAGRLRVFPHSEQKTQNHQGKIYVGGLDKPHGLSFYPPGADPRFIYVATEKSVLRFPYVKGDLAATGAGEVIIKDLPSGGHSTRDIAFSEDGKTLFLSIGSETNVAEGLATLSQKDSVELESLNGRGSSWGMEQGRAVVLTFEPDGKNKKTYATGLRNCSGMAVRPTTDELWCVVNERDMLGDNLPPDYATYVKKDGFYGWPWFYIGGNQDPRHLDERPDLANQVTIPDVLFQAHSAPLSITFYQGNLFPTEYLGDAFVALHGSWNRAQKTGYKVVRLKFRDGQPTGEYQDFLTGFVRDNTHVWGRPASVAVASDGSLLVSDDVSGTIWRVIYDKR